MSILSAYDDLLYSHVGAQYGHSHRPHPSVPRSDILLNLPVLEYYAGLCQSAVEFGTRDGHSTLALAAGLYRGLLDAHLSSFDIHRSRFVDWFTPLADGCRFNWRFQVLDTICEETADQVPEADLFFFDTLHTDHQIREELRLHGHKARKFLAFHDTATCGCLDLSGANPLAKGILEGIFEYADKNNLREVYRSSACNGVLVLAR